MVSAALFSLPYFATSCNMCGKFGACLKQSTNKSINATLKSARIISNVRHKSQPASYLEEYFMNFDYQPVLKGKTLELRPLLASDFNDLFTVASDPRIWEQHPVNKRYEKNQFLNYFTECIDAGGALIVVDSKENKVIGASRFHCHDRINGEIEIGWTFLARSYWGGVYNREMKQLMLKHAFKYVDRVNLLVGTNNIRSQHAVENIGGTRVGLSPDGNGNSSIVYQITKQVYIEIDC